MTTLTSPAKTFRYSTALVALHWFMALLFVAVYASIELRVLFPKGTDMRDLMKALHFMFGLGVLLMVLARLGAPLGWKPGRTAWPRWATWPCTP
jgi:superoxide oxidase